ncbi:MAG: YhjD/YihY/BrkB family envelope integrity protein, partial [Flavobacteriales bacterium]
SPRPTIYCKDQDEMIFASSRESSTATPGAAMTTLLMVLLSLGFSFFIAKVNTYNRLYGSLGTLLLLLVWVNANSAVLLLGFELDASIEKARREAMTKFSGGARGGTETKG